MILYEQNSSFYHTNCTQAYYIFILSGNNGKSPYESCKFWGYSTFTSKIYPLLHSFLPSLH